MEFNAAEPMVFKTMSNHAGFLTDAMICREFPYFYSAQIDGQASEAEQIALQRHLRMCLVCRRRAAEIRALGSDLRMLPPPPSNRTSVGEIQIALRHEAELRASQMRRRADWIDLWRTRLFSQGIGAAVSMCLFFLVITGVFRPAYRALALAEAATQVIFEDPTIRLKVLLLQPPPPPVFTPNGDLLMVGASLSEHDEIIANVKVNKDGRASINEIVAPSSNPSVMATFSNVITQQASFQPVRRDHHTSRDAVVIMISMNVPGRASI
jgi:hypothetical protein